MCIPIPLLVQCPAPSPTPSPTTPGGALGGVVGGVGGVVGGLVGGLPVPVPGNISQPGQPPLLAVDDPTAPIMTLPAAQLGGSSLSFTNLKSVSLVTVPLINGTRVTVLKLEADDIVITDFMLDVKKEAGGTSLVTNTPRMELRGHVIAYIDSATATLLGGTGISFGAQTPPPGNELPNQLLRVNLGLVGVFADRIFFSPVDQQLH